MSVAIVAGLQYSLSNMAIAHARLNQQGNIGMCDGGEKRFFDEATRLLLVTRGDRLLAYKFPNNAEVDPSSSNLQWTLELEDAKDALAIHISHDEKTIAVHRSDKLIQFVDRESGNMFVQGCSSSKKMILGMFFVECPDCELVMVTNTCLELYRFGPRRTSLKLRDKFRHTIRWYKYTYATRVVILGVGSTAARLAGYQFTSVEIIKLPQVDLDAAPFPVAPDELLNASMMSAGQPPPLVTTEDVVLLRLYNRVFIGHIDRARMRLRFYRVFMDTIMLVREYELFSPILEFSVVDNVILVHQVQASVVVLFDVASPFSEPVGSPLPVAVVPSPDEEDNEGGGGASGSGPSGSSGSSAKMLSSRKSVRKLSRSWDFFLPDLVVDDVGRVYKVQLDLAAVIASYTDPAPLVGFLNRRRVCVSPEKHPKQLLLQVLRDLMTKALSPKILRRVFNTLLLDGSEEVASERGGKRVPSSLKLQSQLLGPQEIAQEVFRKVLESGEADPAHLECALLEYMDSADNKNIDLHVNVYLVLIDLLLMQDKVFQLQQVLSSLSDVQSLFVAEHLEGLADEGKSETARKLSLDIYSLCGVRDRVAEKNSSCELYCKKLLKEGQVVKALRVAQHHQITSLSASSFLEAAEKTNNQHVMHAVRRFCSQPTLRQIPPVSNEVAS